jgi:hypothetical protein
MRIRILGATAAALLASFAPQSSEADKAGRTIKAGDIQRHQVFLASDELEGREGGSEGGLRAAYYIADHLAALGFEGGAGDGTFFQPFGGGNAMGEIKDVNLVRLAKSEKPDEFKYSEDFVPHSRSRGGSAEGTVVVVGYGITAPEFGYDDWKPVTASAKGAIALAIDGEPQEADENSKFDGAKPSKYAEVYHKIEMAEKAGASALLIASKAVLARREEFTWPPPPDTRPARIPVILVSAVMADKLAGKELEDVRKAIDADLKPRSYKTSKSAEVSVSAKPRPGKGHKNVLGIWRGSDSKLKEDFVVIGAHYDHVGRGRQGSRGKSGEIHNGADDNASGTSTLLDVAEAIRETRPKRSFLLMWFDAEEKGLLGSIHWCGAPTVPLDRVVGMFNMDMIGRNDATKILIGVQKEEKKPMYAKLAALLGEGEKRFGIKFDWDGADDLIRRSDHWSFMEKGVPAVFFTGGLHADYHTERDDAERIVFAKEELIGRIVFWLASKLASTNVELR